MKTSDELLVILGGIGTVVLLFAVYKKAQPSAPAQNNASFLDSAIPQGYTGQNQAAGNPLVFNPPVENINIGATRLGGSTFNIGTGSQNLFPLFGYVAGNGGGNNTSSAYALIKQLMRNNSAYQNGQNNNNANFFGASGNNGGIFNSPQSHYMLGGSGIFNSPQSHYMTG